MTGNKHGQPGKALDLPKFNAKRASPVRIVDHALAVQGWPRSARAKILRALKAGLGDETLSAVLADDPLTDGAAEIIPEDRHARCCQSSASKPTSLGRSAQLRAAGPIDK